MPAGTQPVSAMFWEGSKQLLARFWCSPFATCARVPYPGAMKIEGKGRHIPKRARPASTAASRPLARSALPYREYPPARVSVQIPDPASFLRPMADLHALAVCRG